MPSVTWPGASSSVWYQPSSLACSSACTAHTLKGSRWWARRFERPRDRLVVGAFAVARGGGETLSPQALAKVVLARQPAHRRRERLGRLPRRVDEAVALVLEVLARTARARGHDRAADGHRLERHEPPRLVPLDGKQQRVAVRDERGQA